MPSLFKNAKRLVLVVAVGLMWGLSPGALRADNPVATADASCDKLYSFLRMRGGKQKAFWTTNYHNGKVRFAAATELEFELGMGILFSFGTRQMKVHDIATRKVVPADERAAVEINPDAKIMLHDCKTPGNCAKYGPYYAKCTKDRFMVFDTGDSIETIVFEYGAL